MMNSHMKMLLEPPQEPTSIACSVPRNDHNETPSMLFPSHDSPIPELLY